MSFDSVHFALFFSTVLGAVFILRRHVTARNIVLLLSSYYFYACWDWRFLGLIILSTGVDYVCGRLLNVKDAEVGKRIRADAKRKAVITASLLSNLSILGFFKYFDFFVESAAELITSLGLQAHTPTLRIILPVGISFYTFQTLSYTIDLYRGRLSTEKNLLTFALFVAFFPQLVAGPIERARHLLPQLGREQSIDLSGIYYGFYLIATGLFKKVVIADNVATFANIGFAEDPTSGLVALLSIYAFAIQIYCDFSGYSDIARGAARCLGFDLMLNFNLPYFSTNPREFWKRWHISLSSWLRDYLYISLGGNRRGSARTYVNLMLTMVLGGLWHGAAWTFIAWGSYHGGLLCLHRVLEPGLQQITRTLSTGWKQGWFLVRWVAFFHLVCLGWLLFRAESLGQATSMLASIVTNFTGPVPTALTIDHGLALLGCGLIILAVQLVQYATGDLNAVFRLPGPMRSLVYAAAIIVFIVFGNYNGSEFIYFQF